jgi:type IV secretory pathway TrbF-like protein
MEMTITLPDVLAARLRNEAQTRQRSATEVAIELLGEALGPEPQQTEDFPLTLDEVVAKIRALPSDPSLIRQPTSSLETYLADSLAREAEDNNDFDIEAWQKEWNAFEAELKAVTRANDIAEGQG